jgi:hypothetical protein
VFVPFACVWYTTRVWKKKERGLCVDGRRMMTGGYLIAPAFSGVWSELFLI